MRRHSDTHNYGRVVPTVLTTLAGFLAFVANPPVRRADLARRDPASLKFKIADVSRGCHPLTSHRYHVSAHERRDLYCGVRGTTEDGEYDHYLHAPRYFIFLLVGYACRVRAIRMRLYGVKTSTGVMSEHELVSAFVKADHDHSGVLDKKRGRRGGEEARSAFGQVFKLRKKLDRSTDRT